MSSAAGTRVLMIEDDIRLAEMLRTYLREAGFVVTLAEDAARGLRHLGQQSFDIVLLDLMLPDADGLDVCRQIRTTRQLLPIIMVTARGETMDRVVGLELGADDYLAKPFEPRELLARMRAVLRRQGHDDDRQRRAAIRSPRDRSRRAPGARGRRARVLTARQFDLLLVLAERAGRVLSREQLFSLMGAEGGEAQDRAIDVHVAQDPGGDRGRSAAPASPDHRARCGLRVRARAGLIGRACTGSSSRST